MAVEIGSQFDVFDEFQKNRKEVGFNQVSGMDVYNFLHMVSSAGRINSNTTCLGEKS